MGRNLVVFSDGTGNSAATPFKSNVWRLYQALDLSSGDQIAAFDDGVGTSGIKPLRMLGLALGIGLKRNVIDLYKFLCRNWQEGDRIYAFGFSRGAFTIRTLNGLINREGLVTFNSEEELHRNAVAAYRSFRKNCFRKAWPWISVPRWLRDTAIELWSWCKGVRGYTEVKKATIAEGRGTMNVYFLGLWDTVAAYGLPIDELTRAVDKWIWPMSFGDRKLPKNVIFARQVLSLDDERRTFCPIPWDEGCEPRYPLDQSLDHMQLLQVWFAGVHANVGGGYPDDSLAHVSLCWMIAEAHKRKLRFKNWMVAGYAAIASPQGPIYDSRSGLAAYYPYQPRDVSQRMGEGIVPLVDASVIFRIADGNDRYAPISLPQKIRVLTPLGHAINFTSQVQVTPLANPAQDHLPLPAGQERDLVAETQKLHIAIGKLCKNEKPPERTNLFEIVGDLVWWRRVVYFVTLCLTMAIVLYPVFGGNLHSSYMEFYNAGIGVGMRYAVDLARVYLPDFAAPWLSAISKHPAVAGMIGFGILATLALSKLLRVRISDRARMMWSSEEREKREPPHRHAKNLARIIRKSEPLRAVSRCVARFVLPGLFLALTGYAALCLIARGSFDIAHSLGTFCTKSVEKEKDLTFAGPEGTPVAKRFATKDPCWASGVGVNEGARYLIRLEMPTELDWFDHSVHTDVGGFSSPDLTHFLATLLKRWWNQPWFKPIARIGWLGSDEYPLDAIEALPPQPTTDVCALLENKSDPACIAFPDKDRVCASKENERPPACDKQVFMSSLVAIPDKMAKDATWAQSRIPDRRVLSAEITARTTGELFLYVNDAVGLPFFYWNAFYDNNTGTAKVIVQRITAPIVQRIAAPLPDKPDNLIDGQIKRAPDTR